jgi:tryptophan-rich sensory protein
MAASCWRVHESWAWNGFSFCYGYAVRGHKNAIPIRMLDHVDVLALGASIAFGFWGIDDPRNQRIRDVYDPSDDCQVGVMIGGANVSRVSVSRPPWYVFAVVWPLLYMMISASLFFFWRGEIGTWYLIGLGAFVVARIANRYWTAVYVSDRIKAAAWMIVAMQVFGGIYLASVFLVLENPTKWLAAGLYIPLLAWQCYALYLNIGEYRLETRSTMRVDEL